MSDFNAFYTDTGSTSGLDDSFRSDNKRFNRNFNEKKRRQLFNQLLQEVYLVIGGNNDCDRTDKTTILSDAIQYLKFQKDTESNVLYSEKIKPNFLSNWEFNTLLLNDANAFLIVFGCVNGTILFMSEECVKVLCETAKSLTGTCFYNCIHSSERFSVQTWIDEKVKSFSTTDIDSKELQHELVIRCSVEQQLSRYIGLELTGYISFNSSLKEHIFCSVASLYTAGGLTCLDLSLPSSNMFDFSKFEIKLSEDFKLVKVDEKVLLWFGYGLLELCGHSLFNYIHQDDLLSVISCLHLMKNRKFASTQLPPVRFRTKSGLYIWINICLCSVFHNWTDKPDYFLCEIAVAPVPQQALCVEPDFVISSPPVKSSQTRLESQDLSSAQIELHTQLALKYSSLTAAVKRCQTELDAVNKKLSSVSTSKKL